MLAEELGLDVDRVRLITGSSAGCEDAGCAMRRAACGCGVRIVEMSQSEINASQREISLYTRVFNT